MRRSTWLVIAGITLLTVLGGLGFRARRQGPPPSLRHPIRLEPPPLAELPAPRDYVREPVVEPAEVQAGPRRIISLAPSITEMLCALGLGDRLIGRTPYCQYPPGLERVPAVGALTDTNFERIRALSPDVVFLTSNSVQVAAGLRKLGVVHQEVPHNTLPEVFEAIELLGRVCERPRTATRLISALRDDLERLSAWGRQDGRRRWRVMMVLGDLPLPPKATFVAGPGSFLDGLLGMAGLTNAVTDTDTDGYVELPLERIVMLDPEAIIECRGPFDERQLLAVYTGWQGVGPMQAIAQQRIRSIGGPEFLSATPRINITLYRLLCVKADL